MPLAGLSLGSNLGDRLANLRRAVIALAAIRISDHLLASKIYETDPVDCEAGDPEFFNAVVEIETSRSPEELLAFAKEIESSMGRPAVHEINSPRVIDVDILYYDDLSFESDQLRIPHPRMGEREFVMRPLADIRPDLVGELPPVTEQVRLTGHSLVVG